jgi:hypothetical protein
LLLTGVRTEGLLGRYVEEDTWVSIYASIDNRKALGICKEDCAEEYLKVMRVV